MKKQQAERNKYSTKKRPRSPEPTTAKRRGASGASAGFAEKIGSFLRHHKYLLLATPKRLLNKPAQTLMTSLVIAIALGLPAFFYSAVVNLQTVGGGIESTGQMTLFLKLKTSEGESLALQKIIESMPSIAQVQYVSSDQALKEFKRKSGFGDVLDLLEENPLPTALLVRPKAQLRNNQAKLKSVMAEIKQHAVVDDILLDMAWLERLNLLLRIAANLTLALGGALSLGVLLIVGNTIRLEIENRKSEIQVVKLMGGTDAYVKRPFLYFGAWYGVIGGIFAWLLVMLVLLSIRAPVSQLAALYDTHFQLEGVSVWVLMMIGLLLGFLGSSIAVSSHIRTLDGSQ